MRISEKQLLAKLCRLSYEDFVRTFWPIIIAEPLRWAPHMSIICDEMQYLGERIIKNKTKKHDLVINVPPGTSKSTLCSIMFTPWMWTRMPSFRYIGASYSHDIAMDHSRKGRDLVKSDLYGELFPEITLRDDQDSKKYYATTKGGQRYSTGSMGTVQGMHAHMIGIDDPLDPGEALSEVEMKRTNGWIKETLSGRKVDRRITPMVLIMQRLHQDDPTAQFLMKKHVKHICLPAEITDNVSPPELRSIYRDGLLDPRRLSREVLDEAKQEFGPYGYAGQFLEDPVPPEGGMFDVDKLKYGMPGKIIRSVRYWDKAGTAHQSKKGRGAWTVGVKMGIDETGRIFVLDVKRVRMEARSREALIRRTAVQDGARVRTYVEQEPGSGGKESAQNTVMNLSGFLVGIDRPTGDKETRADPFSCQVNGENVWLVPADWNKDYVSEMKFFPFSTTKDQVDASSGAFNKLCGGRKRVGGMRSRKEQIEVIAQETAADADTGGPAMNVTFGRTGVTFSPR